MAPSSKPEPLAAKLAIGAAVALCFFSVVAFYKSLPQDRDPFLIQMQPSRIAGAAAALPAEAIVGYLTDVPLSTASGLATFGGVRFALAPRLVTPGPDREWVIGNFSQPADFAALAGGHGLTLQADYSNGIVLFRRLSKP
jgi:hypothetical protein